MEGASRRLLLPGHLDGLDGSSGCHQDLLHLKTDRLDRIDHAACRLSTHNLIKFVKKLAALGIDSRLSNGEKFWLLVTNSGKSDSHPAVNHGSHERRLIRLKP